MKDIIAIVDIVIAIIATILYCIFLYHDKDLDKGNAYYLTVLVACAISALLLPAVLYLAC